MKIAVIGLGGVGGYFGGKLALKYALTKEHDIYFIVRGKHLAETKRNGLKVISPGGDFTAIPTIATDNPKDLGSLEVVFFCVKTYDLENAALQLVNNIAEKTVVITLLNGVDNAERLRTMLPKGIVLNGLVYISSYIEAPGVIRHLGGPCRLIFGPENGNIENYQYIEDFLRNADINAELTNDITVQVWTKFIFVGPLAGITSLLQKSFGSIMGDEKSKEMLEGMMKEVESVAKKKGIALPQNIVPLLLEKVGHFPPETKTSMQMDFEKGKKTEVESLIGYVVKSGKELGIKTPLHQKLYNELLLLNRP
ncbi:MAG: ketopantoate reductase family protein [Candidatus Jordarchaeum sp.]|uniref:ketopantoate reductase family protein n=1 Tax=Candidatus Jordarchaeum sp. TaxID=2823881 RepID=UPI00404B86D9